MKYNETTMKPCATLCNAVQQDIVLKNTRILRVALCFWVHLNVTYNAAYMKYKSMFH